MSTPKSTAFAAQRQAASIAVIFVLISGIWVYISNYLLFGQSPVITIEALNEIEAISDGIVVVGTALLIYLLVYRSIAQLQQSEQALKEQRERLQVLSHRLLDVEEKERRAIARELHDEIGQALTGLKLSLETAGLQPQGDARLIAAVGVTNELIARVRNLSLDLRPAALDDLGLLPALLWHFERYTQQTDVQVDFRHQGLAERRFEHEIETVACRIVQEALTNVARHAKCTQVEVRVWADEAMLNLRIEDRGVGFDASRRVTAASSGLLGMEERAAIVGGCLTIDSQPGSGTQLVAELPLAPVRAGENKNTGGPS
jgi:signal transduction histidine kinase